MGSHVLPSGGQSNPMNSKETPNERRGNSTVSTLAVVAVFGIALGVAWYVYKDKVSRQQQFQLKPDMMSLTPEQPEWIKADVLQEVFSDQKLEEQYLTDRKLASQLRDAFMLHPCVASVEKVSKRPDGVDVSLVYRNPVAMVVVKLDNRTWLYPVDDKAVVLPPRQFTKDDVAKYMRINHDYVPPAGQIGDDWGDDKVVAAAQIAGFLETAPWQEMGLYNIELVDNPSTKETAVYLLKKATPGFRVLWGSLPGHEHEDELAAPDKLRRLVEFYHTNKRLDVSAEPMELDLRPLSKIEVIPLVEVE